LEYCGTRWTQATAAHYVQRHKKALDGWCRKEPKGERRDCFHTCSQVEVTELFLNEGWGIQPLKDGESLWEWAQRNTTTIYHGTWGEQERRRLNSENAALKRQLKEARKRSAARLDKLKKLDGKTPKRVAKPRLTLVASAPAAELVVDAPALSYEPLDAKQAGFTVGQDGGARLLNPYSENTVYHGFWDEGWQYGRSQFVVAQERLTHGIVELAMAAAAGQDVRALLPQPDAAD
jgi:hypothetical protein